MKELVIIGASGHGKVVADIAKKNGYNKIFFLDDNSNIDECDGYKVVGKTSDFLNYNCDIFVAIGNSKIRQLIYTQIENANKNIVSLIHPAAVIADTVKIGTGSVVMAGAVINSATSIGKGCIVNTCASIDHDNTIGDFVHVSVGSHLAGTVSIGNSTWIGVGATVSNNTSICENCMIGAGAVVVKNIDEEGTYIGVPAKRKI